MGYATHCGKFPFSFFIVVDGLFSLHVKGHCLGIVLQNNGWLVLGHLVRRGAWGQDL